MKTLISAFLLAATFFSISKAFSGEPRAHLVRVQLTDYSAEMRELQSRSIDIAGVDLFKKQADLLVDEQDLQWLSKRGFSFELQENSRLAFSPDSRYQNPQKVESSLKNYAAIYPGLAKLVSIGKSLQGRDIWAIRLSKNVQTDGSSKPHVFFNAMHHAREVMTSEIGLDIVDFLLTRYGKDPRVTHWLDAYEVDVIPMFNVDGNNLVWTSDSMWRKNARGGYGVDINRNYPYAWNSCHGSSSQKSAQDFHGDSAASEPETKVMMDFVNSIHPVFSISYHSYSEIVIYPYGCEGQHTQTRDVVEKIGQELAKRLKTDDGKNTYTAGTAPDLLYSVDGGDIDWLYASAHAIPFVIEVNSTTQGFQPSYDRWREKTVQGQREGWQYLLDRMDGPSIFGKAPSASAVVSVRSLDGKFEQSLKVGMDGGFNIILNPGIYQVSLKSDGKPPVERKVEVGSTRTEVSFR